LFDTPVGYVCLGIYGRYPPRILALAVLEGLLYDPGHSADGLTGLSGGFDGGEALWAKDRRFLL
jgi:hypothetical protein